VIVALCFPRAALAAAPMCDPTAASVVAPIPALPSNTGELNVPRNCETQGMDAMDVGRMHRNAPLAEQAPQLPDRIVVTPIRLPELTGRVTGRPEASELPCRPGFRIPVYRPPRAHA
jgi:hypothetical protein